MTRSLDAIEAVNNVLDLARVSGDGSLWAVVVELPTGARVVGLFALESIALDVRNGLAPVWKKNSPGNEDLLRVIPLSDVPLAFGASLPGFANAPATPVPIPIPARPTLPPRRFHGRRRS